MTVGTEPPADVTVDAARAEASIVPFRVMHMKAFARLVHEQGALASVLRAAAMHDERMLASMRKTGE